MTFKKTVLVIEDALPVMECLCRALKNEGFDVYGCTNGMSALAAAEKKEFEAIITDYRMPIMSGVDVTRHLRTLFPASVIVGVSFDDKRTDFLDAGADAFLRKPYLYEDLVNALIRTYPRPNKPFKS